MKKLFISLILILSCFIYGEEKVLYNKVITNSNPKIRVATYNIAAGANNFKVDLKLTAETIKKINQDKHAAAAEYVKYSKDRKSVV